MSSAVVFAYHNVGVRCLKALLARGVDVALVVTHDDRPGEEIWFDSVRATAEDYRIAVIAPEDPNTAGVLTRVREAWRRGLDTRHAVAEGLPEGVGVGVGAPM